MAPPKTVQDKLEQMNMRMRQIEAAYLRAKEYEKSLDWQQLRDHTLERIQQTIALYFGKDATEAVFICGKIKQILLQVQEPLDVITEYEGLKDSIEMYYAQRGE